MITSVRNGRLYRWMVEGVGRIDHWMSCVRRCLVSSALLTTYVRFPTPAAIQTEKPRRWPGLFCLVVPAVGTAEAEAHEAGGSPRCCLSLTMPQRPVGSIPDHWSGSSLRGYVRGSPQPAQLGPWRRAHWSPSDVLDADCVGRTPPPPVACGATCRDGAEQPLASHAAMVYQGMQGDVCTKLRSPPS